MLQMSTLKIVYFTTVRSSYGGPVCRKVARNYFSVKKRSLHITNTSFLRITVKDWQGMIYMDTGNLYLIGPIVFNNILSNSSIILLLKSTVKFSNYIEFSNISTETFIVHDVIMSEYFIVFVDENATINVSYNSFKYFAKLGIAGQHKYPYCYFQYLRGEVSHVRTKDLKYSIVFNSNNELSMDYAYNNLPISHCSWLPQATFSNQSDTSLEINKRYIRYINNIGMQERVCLRIVKKRVYATVIQVSTMTATKIYLIQFILARH